MSIGQIIKKIDVNREYKLAHIRDEKLFPWVSHVITIRKIVMRDYEGENMLKAKISGEKYGREYRIKGSNIIRFLKTCGYGGILITGKNNNAKKTKRSRNHKDIRSR